MRTRDIQAAVVELIKPCCRSVYFNRAPAVYPRIRAELKRVKTPPPMLQYMLYLDFFGRIDEAAALQDIVDNVFRVLKSTFYNGDKLWLVAYPEDGDTDEISDTAADIKHIMASVPLRVMFKDNMEVD